MKFSRFNAFRAGVTEFSLPLDNYTPAAFSYYEKGVKVNGKPSIMFVHGLASTKNAWIPIIQVRDESYSIRFQPYVTIKPTCILRFQSIPSDHHCIAVDLPAHGETIGLNEEQYSIDKFVEKLKLVIYSYHTHTLHVKPFHYCCSSSIRKD